MKLEGYGLWNISRGLARDVKEYQRYLSYADMKRQGADTATLIHTKNTKLF
jgi:hypothetical protein